MTEFQKWMAIVATASLSMLLVLAGDVANKFELSDFASVASCVGVCGVVVSGFMIFAIETE